MNPLPAHSSVLIVGAGPSGLMMAAQLLRFGIHPIIIDSKTQPTTESRALAIQARSLEIFRQMGIDKLFLEAGNVATALSVFQDSERVASINVSAVGEGKSGFPYVLILEQSKTERILIDHLTANTCPIYWNTSLIDVHQTESGVAAKVQRHEVDEIIHADWLIGADGASSRVRKSLRIPFLGGTYQNTFFLADIEFKSDEVLSDLRVFLKKSGFMAMFPMRNSNYRFIGVLPHSLKGRADLRFEDLKPYLTFDLGVPLSQEHCNWFALYQLHHRMASRFRERRCFLIGDAAHIHSPAGGQGMNTGLQDAYNLAWKLAGVIKKQIEPSILNSFEEERIPVATSLLRTTDRMFNMSIAQNRVVRQLRNWLLPFVLNKVWKMTSIRQRMFELISQTGISYSNSFLSVHHSKSKHIRAGDRLPYLRFFDEKRKEQTDLQSWCTAASFTLITIGDLSSREIMALAKWIKLNYPFSLSFYYLPFSERNKNLFEAFEMGEHSRKALVIRPDLHIGYINDTIDVDLIDTYLKETIGWTGS